jgi:alkylation response protein AidB-like acyl-CoA dehydrogenase
MFRLMMPKEWGGPEMRPAEQVEVIEELAKANASAAWCVMIGCDSGFFAGFLEDEAAREIYPRLDMATAGSATPSGRAERVAGGYRVTGQWSFGSGVTHAEVVELACVLYENGAPVRKGGYTGDLRIPDGGFKRGSGGQLAYHRDARDRQLRL